MAVSKEDMAGLTSKVAESLGVKLKDGYGLGKVQIEVFEKTGQILWLYVPD